MQLSVLTGLRKLRLRGFSMAQDSGVCSDFHLSANIQLHIAGFSFAMCMRACAAEKLASSPPLGWH